MQKEETATLDFVGRESQRNLHRLVFMWDRLPTGAAHRLCTGAPWGGGPVAGAAESGLRVRACGRLAHGRGGSRPAQGPAPSRLPPQLTCPPPPMPTPAHPPTPRWAGSRGRLGNRDSDPYPSRQIRSCHHPSLGAHGCAPSDHVLSESDSRPPSCQNCHDPTVTAMLGAAALRHELPRQSVRAAGAGARGSRSPGHGRLGAGPGLPGRRIGGASGLACALNNPPGFNCSQAGVGGILSIRRCNSTPK